MDMRYDHTQKLPTSDAEMDALLSAIPEKRGRGRPRSQPVPEAGPKVPSLTVSLGRNGSGFHVAFRKVDRRRSGPKLHQKFVRAITSELDGRRPLSAALKHKIDRLASLRCVIEALNGNMLAGKATDMSLLLAAIIEEAKLSLSIFPPMPKASD
jgi:hypothetical protein